MYFEKEFLTKYSGKFGGEYGKNILYGISYILPGAPTYHLIKEYIKPKEKRKKRILAAGWGGTAFLSTKILLASLGILSFTSLKMCDREEKKGIESVITEEKNTSQNNLEGTTFFKN